MRHILAVLLCACGSPVALEDAAVEPPDDMATPRDAVTQDHRAPLDLVAVVDGAAPEDMAQPDLAVVEDMAVGADLLPEADLNPGPHAQAASAFTLDADGWIPVQIIAPALRHSPGVPYVAKWHPSGGNGDDGCLYVDATGTTTYWQAPAKFLGNKSVAYGGSLTFSLKSPMLPYFDQDVILVGGNIVAVHQLSKITVKTWNNYGVPLYAGSWHKDTDYGDLLTEAELRLVLGNLTMLRIRAGAIGVGFSGAAWLDNVSLYRQ